jgi:hypothetical protein
MYCHNPADDKSHKLPQWGKMQAQWQNCGTGCNPHQNARLPVEKMRFHGSLKYYLQTMIGHHGTGHNPYLLFPDEYQYGNWHNRELPHQRQGFDDRICILSTYAGPPKQNRWFDERMSFVFCQFSNRLWYDILYNRFVTIAHVENLLRV